VILSFIGASVLGLCFQNDRLEQILQQTQALEPWPAGDAHIGRRSFQRKESLGIAMQRRPTFEPKQGRVHAPHYATLAAPNQANEPSSTAPGNPPSAARHIELWADNFIKHPRRNNASRLVGEPDIHDIPLATSGAKDLELLSEEGIVWIENL
jgi:hypothetical protein